MIRQIQIYKKYIQMLLKTNINSIICHSKAGYGKTHTTLKTLNEHEINHTYVSGVTTAVELYKLLYDNNDKIIILDDVETIFQDDRAINILKASLWGYKNKRVVSYKTTSKTLEQYPDKFDFTGKIIILANEIRGRKDESFQALISRSLKYELKYTLNDIKELCIEVLKTKNINDKEKEIVTRFIKESIKAEYNFNLRLLDRLIEFVNYDIKNGVELFLNSIEIDEDKKMLLWILNKYTSTSKQIEAYYNKTGKHRSSFFKKKKELKQEGLI